MLDWWGPVVVEYYAATEGGGTLITAEEWLDAARVGGAPVAGLARSGCSARRARTAPPGEPGQVYMQDGRPPPSSTTGTREKTRTSRAGNLFTVGDIGYLDADGYLYLCDRGSDLIISGGVNIYPAEIEAELACHPKVADVAVFGIPHDDWGEEIKAVVQPGHGVEPGAELTAELLAFAGRAAGPVQTAAHGRLRRRTAPGPERQALQAHPAGLLTGPAATGRSDRGRRRRPDDEGSMLLRTRSRRAHNCIMFHNGFKG